MGLQFDGTPASPGIAIGPAFLLDVEELLVSRRVLAGPEEAGRELERFDRAVEQTRSELLALASGMEDLMEGRQLIDAHILLVDDPTMKNDVRRRIESDLEGAEYAVSRVIYEVIERFGRMKDPYARERSADIRDVGRRLINKLLGTEREALARLESPVVLVARDLDPSVTAGLRREQVLGFATDEGGSTSHTAILARSLGIPAVVALKTAAESVRPRQTVIVDGIHGRVIVDPDADQIFYYTKLRKKYEEIQASIALNASEPARTADGLEIGLAANIEFSQEADQVRRYGGRGIGLFRTEFLRLISPGDDDEETDYREYAHALRVINPDTVIIRTLDIGGDKLLSGDEFHERNPFLGYRAIRVCLDRPWIYRKQLRAIMRASVEGRARLLIPLVTEVSQVLKTREMMAEIAAELDSLGIPYDPGIPVGIMVETPAATIGIDLFLPHVDFVSLGTNDLTQYTLAVDRGSPFVAKLFDANHPAVLRQIDHVVKCCHDAGKWVGVCGQMAAEPLSVPLLVGLGVDELSVSISLIPDIKKLVSVLESDSVRKLARAALEMPSGLHVRQAVRAFIADRFPEILLDGGPDPEA
ncbi:phosphoenolpyruvate--protein phosphotransferase [Candidatus Fermentibacteria bacterium]|nr:phosphoenolpyruvate--protein phosphotransferase [Candidatus Fermentibacteria bacterium]